DQNKRESHWTESIATGSQTFVKQVISTLGVQARYLLLLNESLIKV
ncbi:hypothetical protein MHK_008206, partial [Candidatus Magnetomorum sp. HK-1]